MLYLFIIGGGIHLFPNSHFVQYNPLCFRFAFDYAIKKRRRKVTCIFNKDVMTMAEGLFVNTVTEVSARYIRVFIDILKKLIV